MRLETDINEGLTLDLINENDIEKLRLWKNQNNKFFFQKAPIEKTQQELWFSKIYLTDNLNYIFIIKYNSIDIGTIGVRKINKIWDIYNVMNISTDYLGKGFMSISLKLVIDFAKSLDDVKIRAKVLSDNMNLKWYIKNGFKIYKTEDHFNLIEYKI